MTRKVIGVGHPDCGDDAIGPMVARSLAGRVPADVTVLERPGDMLGLIDDWAGCSQVVLVDAAAMDAPAGTVRRIDLLREDLPAGVSMASTHAFGVADAVALARTLGQVPGRLVAFAVAGTDFTPGAPPSEAVRDAVAAVVTFVVTELRDA